MSRSDQHVPLSGLLLLVVTVAGLVAAVMVGGLLLRPDPSAGATAAPQPLTSPDGYALWSVRSDGTPVRWNPCEPIRWVLDPDHAPPEAESLVIEAFERITAVTGLTSRYLGTVDEPSTPERAPFQPERYGQSWAPVLITWTTPHDGDLPLRTTDRAISIPVAVEGVFVSGQIALNSEQTLAADFKDRSTSWGATLIHEIGHLVGLDHVDDPAQLMYRFPGSGEVRFGAGDLRGLGAIGDAAGGGGCMDAGRPRPVEVTISPRR